MAQEHSEAPATRSEAEITEMTAVTAVADVVAEAGAATRVEDAGASPVFRLTDPPHASARGSRVKP